MNTDAAQGISPKLLMEAPHGVKQTTGSEEVSGHEKLGRPQSLRQVWGMSKLLGLSVKSGREDPNLNLSHFTNVTTGL